ncbi:hypothetical protein [Micromonospora cremea]|uniref:Uncharacterized protein n=1 Tax=Micromonospora cremea TaxID=709881 RepID=A0A1N6A4T2_9ACTN|nr:hypothetical protein [Micromonospora cremea]SIN29051.1 hypothetical protein SAMN04489832_4941 [Micromonospora cremea]
MSESAQQRKPDRDVERPGRADGGGDPDVLLDIPKVSVDSIRLAVDGLDADLSLRARLANLLQLDAGVRVHLQGVELDINGVHAEAQLRVRLEQLMTILSRALDTIDNNPQIIEAISRTAGATIDDVNRSAQQLSAGAAEVTGSAQRSGDVLDQRGRQVADRPRPGLSRPGAGEPVRAVPTGPAERRPEGRPPQGPGPERQGPEGQGPEGRGPERQGPERKGPEGQARDQAAGAAAPGPGPSGGGDGPPGGGGGAPGGAHATAQSAAQLAEQAGETLRQAGRSVWEAIQGGMAQHRQQGRRDD